MRGLWVGMISKQRPSRQNVFRMFKIADSLPNSIHQEIPPKPPWLFFSPRERTLRISHEVLHFVTPILEKATLRHVVGLRVPALTATV